ncbi:YfcC family protein [Borreliella burgdorferi]|uniref:YfcC family protein n=1 Tax=Borreliella burgdorferi TaxID=139 RepID=UPI00016C4D0B|nr:YfcC family protein [Borreliella burgdorferi]ATH10361.1 YfcC family protein [Borreliella burgdorferi]AXK70824.1 Arginine/ornithine antiporter ArcD [Borreliella burgdorferi]EEE18789.1 arginine-ornithine antiporter [Borreliella burgdorferi 72a]EEF83104.1 arginine-ornithine antiporter [Borreliella burgdorferi CA-11.2A]MCD2371877.1 YfcC family protein [Borreliella burgdorferi]
MIKMPSSFTIIFSLIVFVTILTYVIPAGKFDKEFKQMGDGSKREIIVAGTYQYVDRGSRGFLHPIMTILTAMSKGMEHAVEVIVFVLIVGGAYGIIMKTGAIDVGIYFLIKKLGHKDKLLIPLLMFIFSIGGTVTGMSEETLPFYFVMIPLIVALGYDSLVGAAIIALGAGVGTMASTVNPFATGIASAIASISLQDGFYFRIVLYFVSVLAAITYVCVYASKIKKDPSKSLVYSQKDEHYQYFVKKDELSTGDNAQNALEFTFAHKLVLLLFGFMILILIFSIVNLGWWMQEMTMLYLGVAIISAFICKLGETEMWDAFVKGSESLLTAALVIGLARGVMIVCDDGLITDTMLNAATNFLYNLPRPLFIILNEIIQIFIGFVVPSSSGHASLTMPIMAPLADFLSIPRASVVIAMQTASGLINLITPTSGVIMAVLGISRLSYGTWFKFVLPLFMIEFFISILVIIANIYLSF